MDLVRTTICRDCRANLLRIRQSTSTFRAAYTVSRQTARAPISTLNAPRRPTTYPGQIEGSRRRQTALYSSKHQDISEAENLTRVYARIDELCNTILRPENEQLPSEQRVLYVLEQLEELAKNLAENKIVAGYDTPPKERDITATSALLGSVNTRQRPINMTKAELLELISQKAEKIARDANVYITPSILKSYVGLQNMLYRPASFPDIFALYAQKPAPTVSKGGIDYKPSNADKINAAIDSETANAALSMALNVQDLALAIDIINTTFCTTAFKRAKILRQAMIPVAGLAVAPLAAYTLANQFSHLQPNIEPSTATGVAFAGIMTYVAAVSAMGYVSVTTANDQMDRVTWAQGVPLWERWIREEERGAIDRVAGQWGFKNVEKRGDEEGEEWELLRDFVGMRSMVLDKVELMEGME